MMRSIQESLFELRVARWALGVWFLCRGKLLLRVGRQFRGLSDLCWVVRVSTVRPLMRLAERAVFAALEGVRRTGRNTLVDSFREGRAAAAAAASYTLTGRGHRDLLRDLIVLKRFAPGEKGVILLKYAQTFDAVASMLDLSRLMERYTFVLEPCWAGYWDPSLLMYVTPGHPLFVQCFTREDHDFMTAIGEPVVPLKMGPADWVDADLFRPPQAGVKSYDLVMVANWAPHKRHATLFRALRRITGRRIRVLLIGFPLAGWTVDAIRREAAAVENDRITIDILESLPAGEVASHVGRCKVFVFLSRKEGDNKALVEAMFANVPAIVYEHTVGGAGSRINRQTGIFASDEGLADRIVHMLDHWSEFTPRQWALEHSGSANATSVLNEAIRRTVTAAGGRWTHDIVEKTNSPNLTYKNPGCRTWFDADYEFILGCRLEGVGLIRDAVA